MYPVMKRLPAVLLAALFAGCTAAPPAAEPEVEIDNIAAETGEEATEEVTEEPTGALDELEPVTLTVGFTTSETGKYEVEASRQTNGFMLWVNTVNEAGGLRVGNSLVTIDTVSHDDESERVRVEALYADLAADDDVDVLLSPYSSGLTDTAAGLAAGNDKLMLTVGAADDATYQKGHTTIYQVYTPGSRYLTSALNHLRSLDDDANRIAIIFEDDPFAISAAEGARAWAQDRGNIMVLYERYPAGTTDFSTMIAALRSARPDAILGGGHFQDGAELTRQIYASGLDVKYISLLVAPATAEFGELGEAAFGVSYPSQWHQDAGFNETFAQQMGTEWYGLTSDEFIAAYEAEYGEPPSYHAAGGYAAGLILQRALEQAGSTEQEALMAALDAMDMMTFFGGTRFNTSPDEHGLQIGHEIVYVQWQKNEDGELTRVLVWPPGGRAQPAIFPLP